MFGVQVRRLATLLPAIAAVLVFGWSCTGTGPLGAGAARARPAEPDPAASPSHSEALGLQPQPASVDSAAPETNALGQSVLVLPFRDTSKYRGPWDIQAGLAAVVADSLGSNQFLRVAALAALLPRLTEAERRGEIDPVRAVGLGRAAGADWVVLGEIESLTMKRFQATVPLGGYRRYEGWAVASVTAYRVIDGQRGGEHRAEAIVDNRRTGIVNPATYVPLDRQYLLLDIMEWGSHEFWGTLVGQAVQQCAGDLALGLSQIIHPPAELAVSEPKIIDVDGDRAYINVGLVEGIQNGDKYGVWDLGRELRDPETGTVLGRALPRRVAVVQVEQVLSDHLSQVRILGGADQVRKFYTVRAE